MQRLILPLSDCQLNAGYKSARYKQEWGFVHYGADLIDRNRQDRRVYGMGDGKVIAAGMDGATAAQKLGNCVVIVYQDVLLPDGRIVDLSCRMFHLERIDVKAGDTVDSNFVIGLYGSTGAYSSGAHLHVEFDSDVNYPQYAVGIAQSGNIIKRGTVDSTVDPCEVFWLGREQAITAPEAWIAEGWMRRESLKLPLVPVDDTQALQKRIDELTDTVNELQKLKVQIHEFTA